MRQVLVLGWMILTAACAGGERPVPVAGGGPTASAPVSGSATAPASRAARPRIVILGDSLSAGYGLNDGESYPARLQERIDAAGLAFEVANVSVSGDTSAGGLRRLEWALDGDVRVVVLELGANDGLRGLPVDALRENLARMIERAQARGAQVVLAGMEAPPNFGPAYTRDFHRVYPELAARYRVALVPFLLEGVAGRPELNIADGIHPNKAGARIVEGNVWRVLQPLLTARAR